MAVEDTTFIDIDAAFSEDAGAPITVRVRGKDFEFPGQVEASLVYQLLRLMDDEGNLKLQNIPDFWDQLVGQERLEELFAVGLTWKELDELQNRLLIAYGISGETGEGEQSEDPQ